MKSIVFFGALLILSFWALLFGVALGTLTPALALIFAVALLASVAWFVNQIFGGK